MREAYHGGRNEVFGNPQEDEKLLHFDFKGMYQQCMLESLPVGDFILKSSMLDINEPGFYYISTTARNKYPVLPVKEDKLYFRDGCVSGLFWFEEIKLMLKLSEVKDFVLHYGYVCQEYKPVLKGFVESIAPMREGGGLSSKIGKQLINSFYGRLGIKDSYEFTSVAAESIDINSFGVVDNVYVKKTKVDKRKESNVGVAAAIAAKGRIKLREAMQEVLDHGGRPLYCDTDSIFAAFPKNRQGVENTKLGEHVLFDTKKHDTVLVDAVFVNPKTYGLIYADGTTVIKSKGFKDVDLTFEKLKHHFYSDAGFINQKRRLIHKVGMAYYEDTQDYVINLTNTTKRK